MQLVVHLRTGLEWHKLKTKVFSLSSEAPSLPCSTNCSSFIVPSMMMWQVPLTSTVHVLCLLW